MSIKSFYYIDENGKKQDESLHKDILNNPEVDEFVANQTISRETQAGMTLSTAVELFGTEKIHKAFKKGKYKPIDRL